jgi:hypothetical protein
VYDSHANIELTQDRCKPPPRSTMKKLIAIALVIGACVAGGWLLPMLVCSLPDVSDSLVCGHNFWILILPGALLGAIAMWIAVLRFR